eukprot:2264021-Pleurochrysis_carterae.AAC.1
MDGIAIAKSNAASWNCSSISSTKRTVLKISSGADALISLTVFTARSNAGLKSRREIPSACDPWIQYVWTSAMARQADADTRWSLATAVNIR